MANGNTWIIMKMAYVGLYYQLEKTTVGKDVKMKNTVIGLLIIMTAIVKAENMEIVKTGKYSPENAPDKLAAQSFADALLPVRRTFEDGQVFWNGFARQFIYAPYFEFKKLEGVVKYRFTVTRSDKAELVFEADSPYAALTPVWR